jgi:hypothetical protein
MSILYRRAVVEADKVSRINVFLEDTLGSVESAGDGEPTVRDMLGEGEHWIGLVLGERPQVEAAVQALIANGYRNIGEHARAERLHEAALATRRALGDELEVARGLMGLGMLRRDQGRLDEAVALFEEGLEIRERRLGDGHLDTAMARANLAAALAAAGRFDEAEGHLRAALAIRRARLGPVHADVAMSEFTLAELLLARAKNLDEALDLHRRALEARRLALKPAHPDLPRSLMALARTHLRRGEDAAALPLLEECLALRRSSDGPDHPRTRETEEALSDLRGSTRR